MVLLQQEKTDRHRRHSKHTALRDGMLRCQKRHIKQSVLLILKATYRAPKRTGVGVHMGTKAAEVQSPGIATIQGT